MSAILACAVCTIESNGAGRPPAVTIYEGTALCAEHLLERRAPSAIVTIDLRAHRRTDPACAFFAEPRTRWQRRAFDRARGRSCEVCMFVRHRSSSPPPPAPTPSVTRRPW